MNATFILIQNETTAELLNLNQIASATRGPRLDTNSLRVVSDEYVVIVRTVDGKEHRFGGAAGEALWGALEAAALSFTVQEEAA